jgi:hypothetical protein
MPGWALMMDICRGGQNPPDLTNPSRPAPNRLDPGGLQAFFAGSD